MPEFEIRHRREELFDEQRRIIEPLSCEKKEKILFESDLFDIRSPGIGPEYVGEDTLDSAQKIERLRLQVDIIAPVNGRPGMTDDPRRSIEASKKSSKHS